MTIVTEEFYHSERDVTINLTYDSYVLEIFESQSRMGFRLINGIEIIHRYDSGIKVHREGRDVYEFGSLSKNDLVGFVNYGSDNTTYSKWEINLGLDDGKDVLIELDYDKLLNYNPPEPEPTGFEVSLQSENFTLDIQGEGWMPGDWSTIETINYEELYTMEQSGYRLSLNNPDNLDIEKTELITDSEVYEMVNNNIIVDENIFNQNSGYVSVTVNEPEPEPEPEPVINIVQKSENINCVIVYDNGDEYELNRNENIEIPLEPFTVTAFSHRGYKIIQGTLEMLNDFMPVADKNFTIVSENESYLEITQSDLDRYFSNLMGGNVIELEINFITEVSEGTPEIINTFNKLYSVDSTIMRNLSKEIFITTESSADVDFSPWVINTLRLPFKVPESVIDISENIEIGRFKMRDSNAPVLKTDLITLDIGEIKVPEIYKNSYDYSNVEIVLHLPFAPTITLDSVYVINETINIEYVISLYQGDSTINIYSSKINDIFHSENVKMGSSIPFINNQQNQTIGNQNINKEMYNNIKNAFIEVVRMKPYNSENEFMNTVNYKGLVGDESGYLEIDNIILNGDMTSNDRANIKNILRNGVFINGEN